MCGLCVGQFISLTGHKTPSYLLTYQFISGKCRTRFGSVTTHKQNSRSQNKAFYNTFRVLGAKKQLVCDKQVVDLDIQFLRERKKRMEGTFHQLSFSAASNDRCAAI